MKSSANTPLQVVNTPLPALPPANVTAACFCELTQGRFPPGGRVGSEVASSGQTSSLVNHVCERRIKEKFSCHGGVGGQIYLFPPSFAS